MRQAYVKYILSLAAVLPFAAPAAEPPVGKETREWLELQQSGNAASTESRPMTGEVADEVYKRYVDSFSHPIPEKFSRESFNSAGGGGSGSGSGGK